MKLGGNTVQFTWEGIPVLGNLRTGAVMGLTQEGAGLCTTLAERDVSFQEIPPSCKELAERLERGGYLDNTSTSHQTVVSAYLHVTQRCNMSCAFCYSQDSGRNTTPDPTPSELSRAINLLAALGCRRLVISGGEPFLRRDLSDIARLARQAGITEVDVLSNGLLVDKDVLHSLQECIDSIAIAFDGTSAEAVAHLRGKQLFNQVVSAICSIREAGIEARIIPTIHAKNLNDLPCYQLVAEKLEATLSYSLLTAPACALGDFLLSEEELRDLGTKAAKSGVKPSSNDNTLPNIAARLSCGAGVRTLSVNVDGTVYPCHMLHRRELAMGNAFTDSADDITSSKIARSMRLLDVRNFEDCQDCVNRFLCGGGCRARSLMNGHGLSGRDAYCALYDSYFTILGKQLSHQYGRG